MDVDINVDVNVKCVIYVGVDTVVRISIMSHNGVCISVVDVNISVVDASVVLLST